MIEHANIFYIRDFSKLGGVETYTWELVKQFKDKDIAVVYKTADSKQLERVRKYCKAYRHTNQKIKCKVAIINYDVSIIDYICEDAKIYQTVHGDYENKAYTWKPPTHERIYKYIAITRYIEESFKRITGLTNVIQMYNPLSIEENPKKLVLISATRLSPIKGKDRMIKLAKALDEKGINYIWYVFTNDKDAIPSKNVVYMNPRLDLSYWMEQADYLVQLSDTEGCSYSINEMLYRNKAVIVTPLPYLKEIGIEDGKNAYIIEFDCSNIDEVVNKILNVPKFEFKKLENKYNEIIVESKSNYKEELKMEVKVKVIKAFKDLENDNKQRIIGDEFICNKLRADYLAENGAVEIIEIITPYKEAKVVDIDKVEVKVIEEEKPKKTIRKSTSKKNK